MEYYRAKTLLNILSMKISDRLVSRVVRMTHTKREVDDNLLISTQDSVHTQHTPLENFTSVHFTKTEDLLILICASYSIRSHSIHS